VLHNSSLHYTMESQTNAGTTTALIQNLTNGTLFSLDRPQS